MSIRVDVPAQILWLACKGCGSVMACPPPWATVQDHEQGGEWVVRCACGRKINLPAASKPKPAARVVELSESSEEEANTSDESETESEPEVEVPPPKRPRRNRTVTTHPGPGTPMQAPRDWPESDRITFAATHSSKTYRGGVFCHNENCKCWRPERLFSAMMRKRARSALAMFIGKS